MSSARTASAPEVPALLKAEEINKIQIDEKNAIKTLLATEADPKTMTCEELMKTCSNIRNGSGGFYQLIEDSTSYEYKNQRCTVITIRESSEEDAKIVGLIIVDGNGCIVRLEICTGHFLSNMKKLEVDGIECTKEGAGFTMPKIIVAQRHLNMYTPEEFKAKFEPNSPLSADVLYEQEQLKLEKAFSEFDFKDGKTCQKAGRSVRWGLLFHPSDVKQEHNVFEKFNMIILAAIHARLLNKTPEGIFLSLVFHFAHQTDFAIIERNTFCGKKETGGDAWGYWLDKEWTMQERVSTLERDGDMAAKFYREIRWHDDRLHSFDRLRFCIMDPNLNNRKFGLSMALAYFQEAIFGEHAGYLKKMIEYETSISLSCTTAKVVLPEISAENYYNRMGGFAFKDFVLALNEPSESVAKRARTNSTV